MSEVLDMAPPVEVAEVEASKEVAVADSGRSLSALANAIRTKLVKSENMAISAARDILEAKGRVKRGEAGKDITWAQWLVDNQIGAEKAKVALRIAQSSNPEQALAEHRENTRKRVEKHRSTHAPTGSYVTSEPAPVIMPAWVDASISKVEQVKAVFSAMTPDERGECWVWVNAQMEAETAPVVEPANDVGEGINIADLQGAFNDLTDLKHQIAVRKYVETGADLGAVYGLADVDKFVNLWRRSSDDKKAAFRHSIAVAA